jgi:PKD repeat protein
MEMKLFLNYWFIIFLIAGVGICSHVANAQLSEKGIPESFQLGQKNAAIIPILKLDSVHVQKMVQSDKEFRIDNRYGVVQNYDINIKEAGVKTEIKGKGTIWQYKIESNDAFSLGIHFKTYHLPQKAKVNVYNSSKSQLRGAFTKINNNAGNQLSIAEFPGKNMIIEYFEPDSPEFSGELVLGAVSQAYTDFKSAAIDRLGINCPQGDNWQKEKNSVCLMTFHDASNSYFCTGALLNNVKNDQKPYFLTANHCIRTEEVASSLVTYFNYENSTCSSYDASDIQTLSGATFKSGSNYSDFSLLLLNEYPPDEYNPFYAGWDATGSEPNSGVSIHHPNGQPKCIAIDNNPLTSYPDKIQWTSDGAKIISTTLPDTHWAVQFSQGDPEYGSSGAPIFDQNKRIVGQLHGGVNFVLLCGKFSLSWNHSSSHTEQLAHWLDPDSTTLKLDGIWKIPPKANFRAELQVVCPNTPVLFFDQTTQRPFGWLWQVRPFSYSFANGTDSTSQNPQIVFQKEGIYTITLHTTNKYGSDALTQQNYILAKSKLDVKFLEVNQKNEVCGCDLKAFSMTARGGTGYKFKTDKPELIDTKFHDESLFLTLKASANITRSFDTWVNVTGTNGYCSASDSLLLHVIIQPNDNITNAARLILGRNKGFSNKCATVEKNEPRPSSIGCVGDKSWCPSLINSYTLLDNSIWFTFISPSNGTVTIDTNGFDDQIAVYQASSNRSVIPGSNSQFVLIAANDNRSNADNTAKIENLTLDPGKQYWLQVDGNNAAFGDVTIDLISNSLEVFPNPSRGIFNIVISNPEAGIADITVSDIQGRKLYADRYNVNLNSTRFNIDLSSFSKGIYLLNVRLNGSNLSKKLVIW